MDLSIGQVELNGKECYRLLLDNTVLTVLQIRDLFLVSCEDIYNLYKDKSFKEQKAGIDSYYASPNRKLVEKALNKLKSYKKR